MMRVARFVAVGTLAACVHLGVVVLLVERLGWAPLAANVGGWLVALAVSFTGQWRFTFRAANAPWHTAFPRFAALSVAGFLANEAAYAALLHWSGWSYQLLLAGVLVAVAAITYLLSSAWAFAHTPAR